MKKDEYEVGEFIFTNHGDYLIAKEEWNTVEYIKNNSDLTKESNMYKLFHKLQEKKAFKTVIGLNFQKELRDKLIKTGNYKEEDLKHIVVPSGKEDLKHIVVPSTKEDQNNIAAVSRQNSVSLRNSRIINVFLIICILAMFIINIYT